VTTLPTPAAGTLLVSHTDIFRAANAPLGTPRWFLGAVESWQPKGGIARLAAFRGAGVESKPPPSWFGLSSPGPFGGLGRCLSRR